TVPRNQRDRFFRQPESERSRAGFAETGGNSAQIETATEARVTKCSRQSLAHSPAAGDRSRRLGLAYSQIHRSESEIRFLIQTYCKPPRAHVPHACRRFLA